MAWGCKIGTAGGSVKKRLTTAHETVPVLRLQILYYFPLLRFLRRLPRAAHLSAAHLIRQS